MLQQSMNPQNVAEQSNLISIEEFHARSENPQVQVKYPPTEGWTPITARVTGKIRSRSASEILSRTGEILPPIQALFDARTSVSLSLPTSTDKE